MLACPVLAPGWGRMSLLSADNGSSEATSPVDVTCIDHEMRAPSMRVCTALTQCWLASPSQNGRVNAPDVSDKSVSDAGQAASAVLCWTTGTHHVTPGQHEGTHCHDSSAQGGCRQFLVATKSMNPCGIVAVEQHAAQWLGTGCFGQREHSQRSQA